MMARVGDAQIWYQQRAKGSPLVVQCHPVHGCSLYEATLRPLERFASVVYYDARNTAGSAGSTDVEVSVGKLAEGLEALRRNGACRSAPAISGTARFCDDAPSA